MGGATAVAIAMLRGQRSRKLVVLMSVLGVVRILGRDRVAIATVAATTK